MPPSLTATHSKFTGRAFAMGHRRARKHPAVPGSGQLAVSLRREIRERSRHIHRETVGELYPDLAGSIRTDPSRRVRWPEPISENGWSAADSRSTGRGIPKASTLRPSAMPSMPGVGYGRVAMLSHGSIAHALDQTDARWIARMMRTRIPDWRDMKRGNCWVTP